MAHSTGSGAGEEMTERSASDPTRVAAPSDSTRVAAPRDSGQRPALDRWFERTFGDDAPTHLGSGWLSGTVSVFLGACGLGAVAVLHFPEWLSSEQFRAAYPLGLMRALIQLVIGLAFLFGCLNLLLRRKKILG